MDVQIVTTWNPDTCLSVPLLRTSVYPPIAAAAMFSPALAISELQLQIKTYVFFGV